MSQVIISINRECVLDFNGPNLTTCVHEKISVFCASASAFFSLKSCSEGQDDHLANQNVRIARAIIFFALAVSYNLGNLSVQYPCSLLKNMSSGQE